MTPTSFSSLICAALLATSVSGCVTRLGDFTLMSTKNIDLTSAHINVQQGQRATGEDCRWNLLGIPLGLPSFKDAADEAITRGHGNIMVDEVTRAEETELVLAAQNCVQVEGTILAVAPGR